MSLSQIWVKTSFIFLVIAMTVGVLLRMSFFYNPITFNYKYLLHTHSHIVLLGWAFNVIASLLYHQYEHQLNKKTCKILFCSFQVSIIGMLLTFPFQGYALYSIIFSTMHILTSYVFVIHFIKAIKSDSSIAARFIKLGLLFYLISTIGPFSLGPIMATGMSHTPIYDLAIYFYLHFLYNGFFTLSILSIFFKSLENSGVDIESPAIMKIYRFLGYAIVPSFVLSMFCYYTFGWLHAIGMISAGMQVAGFYFLLSFIKHNKHSISNHYGTKTKFFYVGLTALGSKLILQLFSAQPEISNLICNAHSLIIAYLHLVFVGFITFSLIGFLFHYNLSAITDRNLKWSFIILLVGFIFSEIFIALPDISILGVLFQTQNNHYIVFIFSLLILVGTLILTINKPSQ